MNPRELFEDHLPLIEEICSSVCRRNGCFGADAEDFASQVKLALIDDDYARLRRFQGRSSLKGFLRAVVLNLYRDHRNQKWGRWRPSAEARRRGPLARHLDQLLHRDGFTFDEAVEVLRTNLQVTTPVETLADLAAKLPARTTRRFESEEELSEVPAEDQVDEGLRDEERRRTAARTRAALSKAMSELPAEDRLILKMRFEDGFTVTRIAQALRVRRRQLYSRFEKCLKRLRGVLEEEGLDGGDVLEIVGWDAPAGWPGAGDGNLPTGPV